MAEAKPDAEQVIDLSDDDVQAARRLLSTERSALRTAFLFYAAIAIIVFACPMGLFTVWFERGLGIGLLIASAVAFAVACVIIAARRVPLEAFFALRRSIEGSRAGRGLGTSIESSQVDGVTALLGCGALLGMLVFLLGAGWFLYDLITIQTINLLSLIMIAVPVAAFFLLGYYQIWRSYLQYSRVKHLGGLLDSQSQEPGKIAVPSEEVKFLAQLESVQMIRKVSQAVPEMRKQLDGSYAIRTAPEARDYIRHLSTERGEAALAIRQTIDALESNPRPPEAQQVPGSAGLLTIRTEDSVIVYRVGDDTRSISIVDIRSLDEEVEDAS